MDEVRATQHKIMASNLLSRPFLTAAVTGLVRRFLKHHYKESDIALPTYLR